ncbi:MAG: hypothetical protein WCK02_06320 [Bacteroidota bacterium]
MINSIIAYDIAELEKYKIVSEAKSLFKSKILSKEQFDSIQTEYHSNFFAPSVFMRILLFLASLFGMSTLLLPVGMIFGDLGMGGYRVISFVLGIIFIGLTEFVFIKDKFHYKSGITEAGVYVGLSFIATGILGFDSDYKFVAPAICLILATFAAIRYLNFIALALAFVFFGWIVFQLFSGIGGYAEALIPFVFMIVFGIIFWQTIKMEKRFSNFIFKDLFIVAKTICLLVFYIAGNYFVVRELSVNLMDLKLTGNEDIPFAFIFYALTALVPIAYLYWGIMKRSIIFIRVSMLTLALSVVTFKYYFSLGYPVVTITASGAILITAALLLLNYLKQTRSGYTRERLLTDKWSSQDLSAFITSQTLGGNAGNNPNSDTTLGGGDFGGGGAGSSW